MNTKSKDVTSYNSVIGKNAKGVDKLIELAVKSLKSMRNSVQVASVGVLVHAEKHGDYSKAQVLVDALGNGINKASLQKWFVDFGGLTMDEESGVFDGWKGKEYIKANFANARSEAWWEQKEAPAYKGFDLQDALNKVYKMALAANKKAEETKNNKELSDSDKDAILSKIEINEHQLELLNATVCNEDGTTIVNAA